MAVWDKGSSGAMEDMVMQRGLDKKTPYAWDNIKITSGPFTCVVEEFYRVMQKYYFQGI